MSDIIEISHPTARVIGRIPIPGSKSESNRLLLLRELYFPELSIEGLSDSRDTSYLKKALSEKGNTIYTGDAGTATRFLTAFYATKSESEVQLGGTERMHQRPIGILVNALQELGADIAYTGKKGYPPLHIKGKILEGGDIEMDGSVSSQFITALMLIGPGLKKGLRIKMKGFSVSAPYIYLTANLMRKLGFQVLVRPQQIEIEPYIPPPRKTFTVEPDWSSASYWFLMALLAKKTEIYLPGFREYSLQGDAFVSGLFEPLGLAAHFIGAGFRLKKEKFRKTDPYRINLVHNPDLAQTMAVALAALNIKGEIRGLQTLKIKETDRLVAIKNELEKTGAVITIGDDFLRVESGIKNIEGVIFESWNDHRMAMSLAPLALLGTIRIKDPDVVQKSYQSFWKDLERVGFKIKKLQMP